LDFIYFEFDSNQTIEKKLNGGEVIREIPSGKYYLNLIIS